MYACVCVCVRVCVCFVMCVCVCVCVCVETEQEILEMRRQQMHEEKKLEQEATRARVRAETEGRIKEERDNIDIHLRKMRAQSGEARKTKLESIRAWSESIGGAYTSLTADKPRLYTFVSPTPTRRTTEPHNEPVRQSVSQ
eukprot:GHVU01198747.1.p1 GENE.GHVU01198747.1~~GHVU01198747.1.p1  ORF type:complete len:141 (-),score=33.44 GHVU01198747.1:74-496(-)